MWYIVAVPFRDSRSLETHFFDHAALLGVQELMEYAISAENFLNGPLCATCSECNRPQGGRVRFDIMTSRYGAVSALGHIATYMVVESICHEYPTNWEYFVSRCN
jgi:hypothetical protein